MRAFTITPMTLSAGISLALHATLLFGVTIAYPDAAGALREKALDIILVNAKSANKPLNPQALAQANLDGGGNVEEDRRAKTPLPITRQNTDGTEIEQAQRRVQQQENHQQQLLAQLEKSKTPVPTPKKGEAAEPAPTAAVNGADLAESARAKARLLEAEIAKSLDEYSKRPRKKNIGARTEEYRFAQYIDDWRQKVERIGTLNYPDAARGKTYGALVMTLSIHADGSVSDIEITRSSGHKVLDDAARRIVQMASPYAAFPPEISKDTDILQITRTWRFTRGDSVETDR